MKGVDKRFAAAPEPHLSYNLRQLKRFQKYLMRICPYSILTNCAPLAPGEVKESIAFTNDIPDVGQLNRFFEAT